MTTISEYDANYFNGCGRYLPSLSKTYKMDIKHCSSHAMRKHVDVYCKDVVDTFKILKSHWPLFTKKKLEEKFDGQPHPVFLQPKARVKKGDQVWFQKSAIGRNTLGKSCKLLIEATPGIHHNGRVFTNKTTRRMAITRMEEGLVPAEKAMKITGHRDYKSYKQYNENP